MAIEYISNDPDVDPLSHPRAAFNGHTSRTVPVDHDMQIKVPGTSSNRAPSLGAISNGLGNGTLNPWQDGQDVGIVNQYGPSQTRLKSPPVNPFHLMSHPESDSALPPLPSDLEHLETDGQQGTSRNHTAHVDPPVHIKKVTQDTVYIVPGSVTTDRPRRTVNRVTSGFQANAIVKDFAPQDANGGLLGMGSPLAHLESQQRAPIMQGPPPSPPISIPEDDSNESLTADSILPEDVESGASEVPSLGEPTEAYSSATAPAVDSPLIYTNNLTSEPADLSTSSPLRTRTNGSPSHLVVPEYPRRPSSPASSRTGSLTVVRSGRLAPQRPTSPSTADDNLSPSQWPGTGQFSPSEDGIASIPHRRGSGRSLEGSFPAGPSQPRIVRRSTNAVAPSALAPRSPLFHTQSTFGSPIMRSQTIISGMDGAALDSDILVQQENIRRERLERRLKKAGASGGLEDVEVKEKPGVKQKDKEKDEIKVLVGNLIGEDHVNYVLMYNMLTGIRIGVSRCQAKIKRPLKEEDYHARHKFSFDIVGNELTPSARYDFKFKDYAPWVFRDLRDDHFHLDPADYLLSLTAKYILSELGSPGKSGSFFYFSRDYRFIIKTISHSEHKFLRSILKGYHEHVKSNPHTLLSRFYGLHRVKLPRGRKIHFVIMNNLFPPHRDIHETYDLKGSAFGREYPEEKAKTNPRAVLKDKNWVNRNRTLELGPEKRALLTEQLRRDMEFLKRMNVMDYSLLVGIHNMERGNRDNLRENQLSVFHPELVPVRRKPSSIKGPSEASNVRNAIRRSDPKMLDVTSQLPTADSADRRHFLFYQDEGGLRATDEANQNMDVIYYLGVIDICTPYHSVKKLEHFWKSMTEDRHTISCVDPVTYGRRFLDFLMSVMRGGDAALRPAGLQADVPKSEEKPVGGDTGNAANMETVEGR